MTEYKAILACTDKHLHDCDTLVCEQTAFLTAYSAILGRRLTSDIVWDYFFKAVQRPSLLPKDSAEFLGWYDALPQTQSKSSDAYKAWAKALPQTQSKDSDAYKAWAKASPSPMMQPKKTEAFREWLQAVRESASQRSVD